jgi:hypothetical protein
MYPKLTNVNNLIERELPCNATHCRAICYSRGGPDNTNLELLNRSYRPYSPPRNPSKETLPLKPLTHRRVSITEHTTMIRSPR